MTMGTVVDGVFQQETLDLEVEQRWLNTLQDKGRKECAPIKPEQWY